MSRIAWGIILRLSIGAGIAGTIASCSEQAAEDAVAEVEGDYCDAISDYATAEDCADFQKQADRQTEGTASFNAPNPIKRNDSFTVWLAVAANPPPASRGTEATDTKEPTPDPRDAATDEAESPRGDPQPIADPEPALAVAPRPGEIIAKMPGRPKEFTVTVGERVKAVLQGDEAFQIEAKSEPVQRVHLGSPYPSTMWRWEVTALRGGDHTMTITTVAQAIDREGNYHDLTPTSESLSFQVQVTPLQKIEEGVKGAPTWIKAVTAIFVALAALIAAIKSVRDGLLDLLGIRRKPEATPTEPEGNDTP
ncbi:hypothetical protein GRI89_08155 [Altererythrobacter salegens]|uniref:Uncharacterized protein n=1 Tax=Croceibacterium salegens TaxID=1737568 RepID=A0A6I4SZ08_9SPHN|nr:hypothetical protein [Croceibacterium salegens]MXO59512.1 hypothetical protein [Croceibacterium salegens]